MQTLKLSWMYLNERLEPETSKEEIGILFSARGKLIGGNIVPMKLICNPTQLLHSICSAAVLRRKGPGRADKDLRDHSGNLLPDLPQLDLLQKAFINISFAKLISELLDFSLIWKNERFYLDARTDIFDQHRALSHIWWHMFDDTLENNLPGALVET